MSPSPSGAAALPDGAPLTTANLNARRDWVWRGVLEGLRANGDIGGNDMSAWIEPLRLQRIDEDGTWHVGAPTRLIRDYVRDNYGERIERVMNAQPHGVASTVQHGRLMDDGACEEEGVASAKWILDLHVGV